jgi:hypothetical protein
MPHLTRARRGTASTGIRTGLGVPGLAHPLVAPAEWAELTRPGTPLHWVVLDVADGPGTAPDPHGLAAAGRLRNAVFASSAGSTPRTAPASGAEGPARCSPRPGGISTGTGPTASSWTTAR